MEEMRFNLNGNGNTDPFWNFVGCCVFSREDITKYVDTTDLVINLTINGQPVDILKAWKMHTEYAENNPAPEIQAEAPADVEELYEQFRDMRDSVLGDLSSYVSSVREGVDSCSNEAASIASEYARDSVSDSFWESVEDPDSFLSEVRSRLNDMAFQIETQRG